MTAVVSPDGLQQAARILRAARLLWHDKNHDIALAAVEGAHQDLEALRNALLIYGKHKGGCVNSAGEYRYELCCCGWADQRDQAKAVSAVVVAASELRSPDGGQP